MSICHPPQLNVECVVIQSDCLAPICWHIASGMRSGDGRDSTDRLRTRRTRDSVAGPATLIRPMSLGSAYVFMHLVGGPGASQPSSAEDPGAGLGCLERVKP